MVRVKCAVDVRKCVGKLTAPLDVKFSVCTGGPVVKGKVSWCTGKYAGGGSKKVGRGAKCSGLIGSDRTDEVLVWTIVVDDDFVL